LDWDNITFFTLQNLLLAKEETMLQSMIDGVTGIEICRMETNVKKKLNENLKSTIPNTNMINKAQLENVEYFNCLGSMVTLCKICT
jgi:hypothetical protein